MGLKERGDRRWPRCISIMHHAP